jgi:hypothetical protein
VSESHRHSGDFAAKEPANIKIVLDGTRRPRSESMKQFAASAGWSLSALSNGVIFMRMTSFAVGILSLVAAGSASAQSVNLTGPYRCVADCRGGMVGAPAFITQNGEDLNLVDEAGQPARAWPDWTAPDKRIWVDAWNQGAVYSPDGMTVHFDSGTIWRRDLGPPPPPLLPPLPLVRRHG